MEEIEEFASKFAANYEKIDDKDKLKFKHYIEKHGEEMKTILEKHNIQLNELDLYSLLGFKDETAYQKWYNEFVFPLYTENIVETLKFYPSIRVDVKNLEFEKKITHFEEDYIFTEKPFRLYRVNLNIGGKDVFIILNKFQHLKIGNDQDLYLKKCDDAKIYDFFKVEANDVDNTDEARLLAKLCKEFNLLDGSDPKYFDERLGKLIQKHHETPIFFELASPLKKEDLLKLPLSDIVWQALDAGLNKDEKLLTIFRMQIPLVVPNPEIITPSEYMEYAPHTIMITSTKPGKTTTGEKVGNILDRPTVTHLLGSASLHEKIHGMLNKENKPTIYDGIEEFKDEDVAKGMLNYMEKGKAIIARGKGVKTEGYSTLLFFSNPEKNDAHASSLELLLTIFHSNLLAIGSRIPIFIYDPKMKEPTGDGIPADLEVKYNKIIEAIQFYSMPIFTKVLKNAKVREWLRKKDDLIEKYIDKLDSILDDEKLLLHDKLTAFINGMKRSWKHLKGGALRLAFMDLLNNFLEVGDNEPIPNGFISLLLKEAEKYEKELISYNLASFTYISSELSKEEIKETLLSSKFGKVESLCKVYEIFLLWMLSKYTKENNPKEGIALPLSTLDGLYKAIPSDIRLNSRYNSFSKFITAIENNYKTINSHKNWLGFHLEKLEDEILCRLDDVEWLKYVAEIDVFNPMTKPITTKTTNENGKMVGQIGQNGVGHEDEYTAIAGFETIKADDVKWAYHKLQAHKGMPKEFFVRLFLDERGNSYRPDEIERLYEILRKRLEDEDETGGSI